ncbi:hypothetical protein NDU88_004948 [Pleurodeles waltl]|uniref:Uncharacterized protein n=1 Tax=Pleurodeles waltl TaxID=8319 RepID=A0AAV7NL22_PLEWA|nr:hypothetical protein NDU88_004948 [Pleurodeles waltl]
MLPETSGQKREARKLLLLENCAGHAGPCWTSDVGCGQRRSRRRSRQEAKTAGGPSAQTESPAEAAPGPQPPDRQENLPHADSIDCCTLRLFRRRGEESAKAHQPLQQDLCESPLMSIVTSPCTVTVDMSIGCIELRVPAQAVQVIIYGKKDGLPLQDLKGSD